MADHTKRDAVVVEWVQDLLLQDPDLPPDVLSEVFAFAVHNHPCKQPQGGLRLSVGPQNHTQDDDAVLVGADAGLVDMTIQKVSIEEVYVTTASDQSRSVSLLQLQHIPILHPTQNFSDRYAVYAISSQGKVTSLHRFRDFEKLKAQIQELGLGTPSLPSKFSFAALFMNLAPSHLNARKMALEAWLQSTNLLIMGFGTPAVFAVMGSFLASSPDPSISTLQDGASEASFNVTRHAGQVFDITPA